MSEDRESGVVGVGGKVFSVNAVGFVNGSAACLHSCPAQCRQTTNITSRVGARPKPCESADGLV